MNFGIPVPIITFVHVVISLIGIASGFVVFFGLIAGRRLDRWTAVFLSSNIATSLTGYLFPFERLLPGHVVGVIALLALIPAVLAYYRHRLAGSWRIVYLVCSAIALYLNVFVGVVQAFQRIPALKALAPTQTETPFVIAQICALILLAGLGVLANLKFRPVYASSH